MKGIESKCFISSGSQTSSQLSISLPSCSFYFLPLYFFPPHFTLSRPTIIPPLSYSTVAWLSVVKNLLTIGEQILMLFSLEQDWNRLLREVPEVQSIETFKTRCHVVQEQVGNVL